MLKVFYLQVFFALLYSYHPTVKAFYELLHYTVTLQQTLSTNEKKYEVNLVKLEINAPSIYSRYHHLFEVLHLLETEGFLLVLIEN